MDCIHQIVCRSNQCRSCAKYSIVMELYLQRKSWQISTGMQRLCRGWGQRCTANANEPNWFRDILWGDPWKHSLKVQKEYKGWQWLDGWFRIGIESLSGSQTVVFNRVESHWVQKKRQWNASLNLRRIWLLTQTTGSIHDNLINRGKHVRAVQLLLRLSARFPREIPNVIRL